MFRRAMKRFLHNRVALAALIIFTLLLLSCVVFPLLGYSDYESLHLDQQYAPISLQHPFSTDNLGRDFFTRMMVGGRYTLGLSLVSTILAVLFGTVIGTLSAYKGGLLDRIVVSLCEALSAVPYILIVIIIEVALGWGKGYFSLAIAIARMPSVIQTINRENRGIDSVTDVLSFPYFDYETPGVFDAELTGEGEEILGDIIVCGGRMKEQARKFGHSQKRELAFLLFIVCYT